ncbi:hypothetical protein KIN20_015860 [Parelaphostrongylus tenuis]|uniref:Uncharacterized protein n=1 Tax=Parelaphostrongylus tenuis TaxID=148309 RepID=A0AAD5QPB9_PARTN|nr:hypothetical protein KIN20_015860 [Parelaphostrongylus tenuis]
MTDSQARKIPMYIHLKELRIFLRYFGIQAAYICFKKELSWEQICLLLYANGAYKRYKEVFWKIGDVELKPQVSALEWLLTFQ